MAEVEEFTEDFYTVQISVMSLPILPYFHNGRIINVTSEHYSQMEVPHVAYTRSITPVRF